MSATVNFKKQLGSFSLEVDFEAGNEVLALLGGSGCGKSMTLKCIAGIVTPDEGQIIVDGVTFFDSKKGINLKPQQRRTGLLFQNYALFPNMTTRQNIMTVFEHGAGRSANKEERYQEIARRFFITGLEDHYPSQLSGGQQQRVALARALVVEPGVLLFDEPLSNLDAKLRVTMRTEIRRIQQKLGITAIYVTHDQSEAMSISDEIIIMKKGVVAQMGSPKDIYYHPTDEFVADFIGEANFIKGTVKGMQGNDCVVTVEGREVTVETDTPRDAGAEGEIVLRPEAIRIAPEGLLPCTVELSCFMGSYQNYHVRLEDGTLVKITDSCPLNKRVFEVGERAAISFDKDCAHLL